MSRPFETDLFKNIRVQHPYKLLSTCNINIAALNVHFVKRIFDAPN